MVRAIVVGAGGIAGAWMPGLQTEGVNIAAVVDINRNAAEALIDKYELTGAAAEDDPARALAEHESDFVVDLTIPGAHCQVTCAALEAGRHVIGEKPMASDLDEARRMVDAADRAGRLYMVSQSRRWNPPVLAVTDAIAAQRLGPLTTVLCDFLLGAHFDGFRAQMDHVLLVDMAIHHFDLARKLSGLDPVAVYAEEFNPQGSWMCHGASAHCIFEMTGGVRFTYRGSWCSEGRHTAWNGNWRLICTDGSIHYENDDDAPACAHRRDDVEGLVKPSTRIDLPHPTPEARGQHMALKQMLAYLAGNGPTPEGECHDNFKSFAMVCAAVESAETGRRVDVPTL